MPTVTPRRPTRKLARWLICGALGLIGLYAVLLIPEPAPPPLPGAGQPAFRWNRDAFWLELEGKLRMARALSTEERIARCQAALERMQQSLDEIARTNLPPDAPELNRAETDFFELSPLAAVCRSACRISCNSPFACASW